MKALLAMLIVEIYLTIFCVVCMHSHVQSRIAQYTCIHLVAICIIFINLAFKICEFGKTISYYSKSPTYEWVSFQQHNPNKPSLFINPKLFGFS